MNTPKKIKVLVISDNPLAPSGVGTQTRYMIESLLRTREFSFVCLAGAIKHNSYQPIRMEEYGDDFIIYPVDGYGSPEIIRNFLHNQKPDIVWFMTDPRFWVWLWEIENEIRPHAPMVYYHVWDNYPYPNFNSDFYKSNDYVCTISKLTDDIVRTVAPEVKCVHIPHTVDTNVFCRMEEGEYEDLLEKVDYKGKFVCFWNNRNARRKQSGTLIWWFKEFLDEVGHDNATLIMHTEPDDPNGQDLVAILEELDIVDGQVQISTVKMPPRDLAKLYNIASCTINISDAEGFGLSTLESLACETPIIVNMTGGLQEQVTDGEQYFGVAIEPTSKAVIGSQSVPYIYEDRISKEDFLESLRKLYNMPPDERAKLGKKGRKHVMNNYSMAKYAGLWYSTMKEIHENLGSWSERRGYKTFTLEEI